MSNKMLEWDSNSTTGDGWHVTEVTCNELAYIKIIRHLL